jgi:hypothetical protein
MLALVVREMFGWADQWLGGLGDGVALAGCQPTPCLVGLEFVVLVRLGEGREFVEPDLCLPCGLGGALRVRSEFGGLGDEAERGQNVGV